MSGSPRPSHLAILCVGWLTDRSSKRPRSRGDYEIKGDFGLLFHFFQISGILLRSSGLMACTVVTNQKSSFLL